jgi:hypothetical protein
MKKRILQNILQVKLIDEQMILQFYPVVKAPGLTFNTLQKYRGTRNVTIRQIKPILFIIKYVSDIILSQSKLKKNRRSHRFVS